MATKCTNDTKKIAGVQGNDAVLLFYVSFVHFVANTLNLVRAKRAKRCFDAMWITVAARFIAPAP
jgi:hypothetical protein